jgi:hypothetical protein
MQQPARHLLRRRQDERVAPRCGGLDRPERRVVDVHELAELREVAAHQGEVMPGAEVADVADPVDRRAAAQPATERET